MKNAQNYVIDGKELKCSFCGNNRFYTLNVKLNSLATSWFGGMASLLAKSAKAFICSGCGKKEEFVDGIATSENK